MPVSISINSPLVGADISPRHGGERGGGEGADVPHHPPSPQILPELTHGDGSEAWKRRGMRGKNHGSTPALSGDARQSNLDRSINAEADSGRGAARGDVPERALRLV